MFWNLLLNIGVPLVKWLFNRKAKKKLTDQEFVAYITAHQKMRAHAGQAAMDWEDALSQAQNEMDKAAK